MDPGKRQPAKNAIAVLGPAPEVAGDLAEEVGEVGRLGQVGDLIDVIAAATAAIDLLQTDQIIVL